MANWKSASCSTKKDGGWIAQGLEFDITAHGASPPEASRNFVSKVGAELVMSIELGDRPPFRRSYRSQKFWQMYTEADMEVGTERAPIRIVDDTPTPKLHTRMKIGELEAA